ncbi:MAG: phosphoribosyl-AMP cyclohydrolase [Nanoarchaeota archaeon]
MKPNFEKLNGLLPVVVQDYKTAEILMLAFMNEEAWEKTLKTKKAHYFSRTRNKLWMKGEESGNIQEVKEIYIDCDEDTVLLKIKQIGEAACHTGYKSCFYRKLENDNFKIVGSRLFNPEEKYGKTKK